MYLGNNYLRAFHGKCSAIDPALPTHPASPHRPPCTLPIFSAPHTRQSFTISQQRPLRQYHGEGCEPSVRWAGQGHPWSQVHAIPPCLLGLRSQCLLPPPFTRPHPVPLHLCLTTCLPTSPYGHTGACIPTHDRPMPRSCSVPGPALLHPSLLSQCHVSTHATQGTPSLSYTPTPDPTVSPPHTLS